MFGRQRRCTERHSDSEPGDTADLVDYRAAVSIERGSYLRRVLEASGGDSKKIRKLYLSALSRYPARREIIAAKKLIGSGRNNKIEAYQDLFWALLNSNEFISIH